MSDNLLEKSVAEKHVDEISFNPNVHESDPDTGDPIRNNDKSLKLKRNWRDVAKDRQGRVYNPSIHGDKPELDAAGQLKVRRRGESPLVSSTNRTKAFVDKYREEGYSYYVMNDESGRMPQFQQNDWEPVTDNDGLAEMKVGQARDPGTRAILMKKPVEWYEDDQKRKRELNQATLADSKTPDTDEGQYSADESSPNPMR